MSVSTHRDRPAGSGSVRRWLRFWGAGAPPAAAGLSYAALLPLAALLVPVAMAGTEEPDTAIVFIGYGALLLSFLAGIRWGQAMRTDAGRTAGLAAAALPALAGWLALLAPPIAAAGILAAAFAAQGAWDVWSAEASRLPVWYGRLRLRTTPITVALLVAALLVLAR